MKRVCITGASGFISRHIIAQLLENGYHVVGTVRDLSAESKVRFLKDLAAWVNANTTNGARLELVEADLLAKGSFDAAFAGCDAVLHVASPYVFLQHASEEEARKKVIDPAVEGTKNVFSAIEKNLNTVKQVIFMSSILAMLNSFSETIDPVINERSWNSVESIEKAGEPYHFSKTAAEKLAWDLFNTKLKSHGVSMIAVNPAYVIGPVFPEMKFLPASLLEKEKKNNELLNEGLGIIHSFFTGRRDTCSDTNIGLVDVRDVAQLFVRALQSSTLHDYDRFLCSATEMRFLDYCKLLKQLFPQYPIPQQVEQIKGKKPASFKCDTSLAKNRFGIEWTDVTQSSKDMVNSFFTLELLERQQKSNTTA